MSVEYRLYAKESHDAGSIVFMMHFANSNTVDLSNYYVGCTSTYTNLKNLSKVKKAGSGFASEGFVLLAKFDRPLNEYIHDDFLTFERYGKLYSIDASVQHPCYPGIIVYELNSEWRTAVAEQSCSLSYLSDFLSTAKFIPANELSLADKVSTAKQEQVAPLLIHVSVDNSRPHSIKYVMEAALRGTLGRIEVASNMVVPFDYNDEEYMIVTGTVSPVLLRYDTHTGWYVVPGLHYTYTSEKVVSISIPLLQQMLDDTDS